MTKILALAAAAAIALGGHAASASSYKHQVLAFYYGWYAPQYGTNWVTGAHWTPAAGAYNSQDPATISRQVGELKNAGITGVIASWWGAGSYTDKQLQMLLPVAQQQGLVASILVEQIGSGSGQAADSDAFNELDYIFGTYGGQSNWLTANNHPVVFLYDRALTALPAASDWNNVLTQIRAKYPGAMVFSPGQHNPGLYPQAAASFDGYFDYSVTDLYHGATLPVMEARLRKVDLALVAQAGSQVACATVQAGYDDSQTTRPAPRPIVQRFDGATYRASWRAAVAANPDWVLVSTYNEWIEGTQIEASTQFGSIGLSDTATYSAQFLADPSRNTGS